MAPPDPDKALNAVRRIAANKVCGTCLHEERMSVTMSNWSMAEVDVLRHENGGGNVVNASKIFARFPQGAKRPQKGCHPDDMKAFIQEAYNDLRWYDEHGLVPEAAPPPAQRTATMQAPSAARTPSQPAAPPVAHSKSAPAAQNLFGDFDAAPAPAANGSGSGSGWASFESAPAPAPAAAAG